MKMICKRCKFEGEFAFCPHCGLKYEFTVEDRLMKLESRLNTLEKKINNLIEQANNSDIL